MQVTKTIAGHQITLENKVGYLATRPIASRKKQIFPVTIHNMDDAVEVMTIDMSYNEANRFMNEFNNNVMGRISFEGRIW